MRRKIHRRYWLLIYLCWVLAPSVAHAQDEQVSISGTLLMLDDKTPHVAVVVQVVTPASGGRDEPTVVATTLSDDSGRYQFQNLKQGRYQVRCYTLKGYVYYRGRENATVGT